MKKTSKTPILVPHSVSKHPHAHMHQHLLPCNKLHDHRQTHTYRMNSISRNTNTIVMRMLHRGTHRKTSQIGVLPIETRGMRGKRSGILRLWCLSLESLWFLTGLGQPEEVKT